MKCEAVALDLRANYLSLDNGNVNPQAAITSVRNLSRSSVRLRSVSLESCRLSAGLTDSI